MAGHKARHRRGGGRAVGRYLILLVAVLAIATGGVVGFNGLHRTSSTPDADPAGEAPAGKAAATPAPHVMQATSKPASTGPIPPLAKAGWVVVENELPGTTAWRITGQSPGTIAGFADRTSARFGDLVTLYVSTDARAFQVNAYRMGYYGGAGARLVWTSSEVPGITQPDCPVAPVTNMMACDNWTPSLQIEITAAFVQGDYLLKLVGSDGQQSYVPLTITDPDSDAALLVKNDVYTWQAWNPYGGYDLYAGLGSCPPDVYPPCNRARVVSFDRPYAYGQGAGDFLALEYPLVRLAEQDGFDVTYATDVTVDQDPSIALHHEAILSLGHDECWSAGERVAVQGAESHGVNVVFFGASPMLRHVRAQASPLGPDREEVDYRDSSEDPLDGGGDSLEVTGNTWSAPPADWSEVPFVGENYAGYLLPGEQHVPLVVADGSSWIYSATGLSNGSVVPGALWSDFDQVVPGYHPADLQVLAHSPMPVSEVQTQIASPYSDMTYYTDPASGAGVFDTGTVCWVPDLITSAAVRQMTVNLLTVFSRGPAGRVRPSTPNWNRFYPQ